MARESRRTSRRASSSLSYGRKRVPPSDGPSAVEWIATIARNPDAGSEQNTTCSCAPSADSCSAALLENTPMSDPFGTRPAPDAVGANIISPIGRCREARKWHHRRASASLGSPAASLRIFEPLVAFPDEQREAYGRLRSNGAGAVAERREAEQAERMAAVEAAVRPALDLPDGAVLLEQVDGLTYACPLSTRLRALVAAGEFRDSLARP